MADSAVGRELNLNLKGVLAWAGIIGPALFVAVFILVGLIKPGYDPIVRFVNEGSRGQLGWIQNLNFFVFGILLLAFALGLWTGLGRRTSGRVGSLLIATAGAGAFGAGLFLADPGTQVLTTRGALHMTMSLVAFLSLTLGTFFFTKRFWGDLPFGVYSLVIGVVIPISFLSGGAFAAYGGLIQRIMLTMVCVWLVLLAVRLRRATNQLSA